MCEPGSQSVVSTPLAGVGLKVVDERGDLAFIDIKVNARPLAKLVD